jgi:hypothetical protein
MTIETKVKAPKGHDTFELKLGITLHNGVRVPVELILVFPEGNGLHAVKAMERLDHTQMDMIYQELIHRQDAAIIQTMLARQAEDVEDEL